MIRAWVRTLSGSFALALISLFSAPLTARALGVEGRGLFASAMLIVGLSAGLAQLGLSQSFVYLHRANHILHPMAWATRACLAVTAAGAVSAAAMIATSDSISGPLALWTIIAAACTAGLGMVLAATQVDSRLVVFNYVRVATPAFALILLIVAWGSQRLSVTAAVGIQGVSAFLAAGITIAALRHLMKVGSVFTPGPSFLSFVKLSFGYYGAGLLGLLLTRADMIFLAIVSDLKQFGLYAAAYGLSRTIAPVQAALGTALFARTAGDHSSLDKKFDQAYRVFRLSFFPMLLVAGAMALLAVPIVNILLGPAFGASSVIFAILVFEAVLGGGAWLLAQQFNAVGRSTLVLGRQVVSFLPIVIAVPFVPPESAGYWLAWLLLVSAGLRLSISLIMYLRLFGVAIWPVWWTRSDRIAVKQMLTSVVPRNRRVKT